MNRSFQLAKSSFTAFCLSLIFGSLPCSANKLDSKTSDTDRSTNGCSSGMLIRNKQKLLFNGYYINSSNRSYLRIYRFYPDGRAVGAQVLRTREMDLKSQIQKVAKWLKLPFDKKEDEEKLAGNYTLDDSRLTVHVGRTDYGPAEGPGYAGEARSAYLKLNIPGSEGTELKFDFYPIEEEARLNQFH